eukprot:TRINITY_DN48396_c0_g1_i1.p1 TRINITY_DN48396_c0_g1~~TRINITY_DN48396_c0_g1_i1.p1  ORF type:complete len:593 (+),score=114.90 TRINITY_DN48396_c0_g1_i1:43-1779(+)
METAASSLGSRREPTNVSTVQPAKGTLVSKQESSRTVEPSDLSESVTSTAAPSPPASEAGEITESSTASVTTEVSGSLESHSKDEAGARVPPGVSEVSCAPPMQMTSLEADELMRMAPVASCYSSAQCVCRGEHYLQELLANMDLHCQGMRSWQQHWVSVVETACRTVLGTDFKELVLVGSLALALETPGSDVDVVCLTKSQAREVDSVALLRKVKDALMSGGDAKGFPEGFNAIVIDDARVPILSIASASHVLVDLAINSELSLEHVKWFHRLGVVPSPPPPSATQIPVLTVTLRCLKWWLRMRRVPRTKDGGLPSMAWTMLAMHACGEQSRILHPSFLSLRPLAAVLALMGAFFQRYTTVTGLHGKLTFENASSASTFQPGAGFKVPCQAELVVADPESGMNLAPPMSPATHILFVHELLRARSLLKEATCSGHCIHLRNLFEPVPEFANSLPATMSESFGALALMSGAADTSCTVELVRISAIHKMPWWQAPFLPRWDRQSSLKAHVFREQRTVDRCAFVKADAVTLTPWNFICRVDMLGDEEAGWQLGEEALRCMNSMRALISDMQNWAVPPSR